MAQERGSSITRSAPADKAIFVLAHLFTIAGSPLNEIAAHDAYDKSAPLIFLTPQDGKDDRCEKDYIPQSTPEPSLMPVLSISLFGILIIHQCFGQKKTGRALQTAF